MDTNSFIIYDVSSFVKIVEENENNAIFKCYYNPEMKEFFIEVNETIPDKISRKSVLLNTLNFAEKEGARIVYACLKKNIENLSFFLVFIGNFYL